MQRSIIRGEDENRIGNGNETVKLRMELESVPAGGEDCRRAVGMVKRGVSRRIWVGKIRRELCLDDVEDPEPRLDMLRAQEQNGRDGLETGRAAGSHIMVHSGFPRCRYEIHRVSGPTCSESAAEPSSPTRCGWRCQHAWRKIFGGWVSGTTACDTSHPSIHASVDLVSFRLLAHSRLHTTTALCRR